MPFENKTTEIIQKLCKKDIIVNVDIDTKNENSGCESGNENYQEHEENGRKEEERKHEPREENANKNKSERKTERPLSGRFRSLRLFPKGHTRANE